MPPETDALVRISLIRALASRARVRKVESAGGQLSFVQDRPELGVWSEIFGKFAGLAFRPTIGAPAVVYRLKRGERDIDLALAVLLEYSRILDESES